MKFEVLTVRVLMLVFWVVAMCGLLPWYLRTDPHSVTIQNIKVDIDCGSKEQSAGTV
jgi:hypothetical protein